MILKGILIFLIVVFTYTAIEVIYKNYQASKLDNKNLKK